jgi:hypothetical protein
MAINNRVVSKQAKIIKGTLKGIVGLLSANSPEGLYVVCCGDLNSRPMVCGPFSPDEVEIINGDSNIR